MGGMSQAEWRAKHGRAQYGGSGSSANGQGKGDGSSNYSDSRGTNLDRVQAGVQPVGTVFKPDNKVWVDVGNGVQLADLADYLGYVQNVGVPKTSGPGVGGVSVVPKGKGDTGKGPGNPVVAGPKPNVGPGSVPTPKPPGKGTGPGSGKIGGGVGLPPSPGTGGGVKPGGKPGGSGSKIGTPGDTLADTTKVIINGNPAPRNDKYSDAADGEDRWGEGELGSPTWFYQWGVVAADFAGSDPFSGPNVVGGVTTKVHEVVDQVKGWGGYVDQFENHMGSGLTPGGSQEVNPTSYPPMSGW